MNAHDKSRASLIAEISRDVPAIKRPGRTLGAACAWLCLSVMAIAALMLALAPFRAGVVEQLLNHARFAVESGVGVLLVIVAGLFAFRSVIPAGIGRLRVWLAPLIIAGCWLGFYLYGLHDPALAPSMAGKRPHCYIEVLAWGLPMLLLGLVLLRRYYPLNGALSGALAGLAAGSIPALLMQFACMYLTPHILSHHMSPVLAVTLIGAVLGSLVLKPK